MSASPTAQRERAGRLLPYRLSCEQPPLSAAYGPPDFFPVEPGCPEEVLDVETLRSGYRWLPEALGVTEGTESLLSLTCHTTCWQPHNAQLLRERLYLLLRSTKEAQTKLTEGSSTGAQAGPATWQPAALPSLQPASLEERTVWLQDLAGSCPLGALARRVPDNISRRALLPLLVQHQVPLPRAVWLVKLIHWRRSATTAASLGATAACAACSIAWTAYLTDALAAAALAAQRPPQPTVTTPPQQAPEADNAGSGAIPAEAAAPAVEPGVLLAYGTRLGCYMFGGGMVYVETLAAWAAAQLARADAPLALKHTAVMLAASCREEMAACAPAAAKLGEALVGALIAERAALSADGDDSGALLAIMHRLLHSLLLLCPLTLVALDSLPQLAHALGCATQEPPLPPPPQAAAGPEAAPAARVAVSHLTLLSRRLSASVNPPLLAFQPAEGLRALWRALAGGDLDTGWRQVALCLGPLENRWEEAVCLVCTWACCSRWDAIKALPLGALPGAAAAALGGEAVAPLPAAQGPAILFARRLLARLAQRMWECSDDGATSGHDAADAGPVGASRTPCPRHILQPLLVAWIGSSGAPCAALGAEHPPPPPRRVAALVLALARAGLFSPDAYMRDLAGRGLLRPPSFAAPDVHAAAQQHRRLLRQLHPQLPWIAGGEAAARGADGAASRDARPARLQPLLTEWLWGEVTLQQLGDVALRAPSGVPGEVGSPSAHGPSSAAHAPAMAAQPLPATLGGGWTQARAAYARSRRSLLLLADVEAAPARRGRRCPSPGEAAWASAAAASAGGELTAVALEVAPPAKRQRRSRSASPGADTSSESKPPSVAASVGPAAAAAAQPRLSDVQAAALAWLGLASPQQHQSARERPSRSTGSRARSEWRPATGPALLEAVRQLRPWEQEVLGEGVAAALAAQLHALEAPQALLPQGAASNATAGAGGRPQPPPAPQPRNGVALLGDMWLQRGVALLVAAGCQEAALVLLLEQLGVAMGALARGAMQAAGTPAPATPDPHGTPPPHPFVSLDCVLSCIDALGDSVAAAGLVPLALEVCTRWGLRGVADPRAARVALARAVAAAGAALAARVDAPDVRAWWEAAQAADSAHPHGGRHWLLVDLQSWVAARGAASAAATTSAGSVGVQAGAGVMGSGLVRLGSVLPSGVAAHTAAAACGGAGGAAPRSAHLGHGLRWASEQAAAAAGLLASLLDAPIAGEGPPERGSKLGSLIAAGLEAAFNGPSAGAQQLLLVQLMALMHVHVGRATRSAGAAWSCSGAPAWAAPSVAAVSSLATCRAVCELRRQLAEGSWGQEAHALTQQAVLAAGLALTHPMHGLHAHKRTALWALLCSCATAGVTTFSDLATAASEDWAAAAATAEPQRSAHGRAMWAALLGGGVTESLDAGQALLLDELQEQLPQDRLLSWLLERTLLPAVCGAHDSTPPQPGDPTTADLAEALVAHAPLRRCLLADVHVLHARLSAKQLATCVAAVLPPDRTAVTALPQRLLVQSLLTGRLHTLPAPSAMPLAAWGAALARARCQLAAHAWPPHHDALWLALRVLGDEQALLRTLSSEGGSGPTSVCDALETAATAATGAEGDDPPDGDRAAVHALLGALCARPTLALALAELARGLGRGVAAQLLQRLDALLRDPSSACLLGRIPLQQALLQQLPPYEQQQWLQPDAGAPGHGQLPTAHGFDLHQGVADAVVLLLSSSSIARQREFAGELVRQLARLGEALRRSALAVAAVPRVANAGVAVVSPVKPPSTERSLNPEGRPSRGSSSGPRGGSPGAADADADRGASSSLSAPRAASSAKQRRTFGAGTASERGTLQRSGSSGTLAMDETAAAVAGAPGPAGAVRASVWLRLAALMPLLPTVRADREADARRNLRCQAASALVALMTAPQVFGGADDDGDDEAAEAAVQAVAQPLLQRLQAVLAALTSASWAGWLTGPTSGTRRLREVPAWEGARQAAAEVAAQRLPGGVVAAVLAALPVGLQAEVHSGRAPVWLPFESMEGVHFDPTTV